MGTVEPKLAVGRAEVPDEDGSDNWLRLRELESEVEEGEVLGSEVTEGSGMRV